MNVLKCCLLAGIGGFIGTSARFLINRLFIAYFETHLPAATFTINILGCFLFGAISGFFQRQNIINPQINALLIVGFCGGFTTFSTFASESLNLGINGEALLSFGYIAASVILGLIAVWFGLFLTR